MCMCIKNVYYADLPKITSLSLSLSPMYGGKKIFDSLENYTSAKLSNLNG